MRATMDWHRDKIDAAANGTSQSDGPDDNHPSQSLAALSLSSVSSSLSSKYQRGFKGQRKPTVPPVIIIIADSPDNEDVVIKVMDEGGGIPRSQMNKIWSYLYTTANPVVQETFLQPVTASDNDDVAANADNTTTTGPSSPILAGLGFGLPMSRAYARYFGGDLDLISLEGYGTDAYLYLPRLGPNEESVGLP